MKGLIKVVFVVFSIVMILVGAFYIGGDEEAFNKRKYVNDIEIYKEMGFIDIADFTEFDRLIGDIDSDGNDEVILLIGKGDKHMLKEAYVVICENITEKVLTSFEVSPLAIEIGNMYDSNGDNIIDISVESHTGGEAGAKTTLFVYRNGEYIVNK